ncbi:uncharacterized protein SPPG_01326 [Spizellomyces punctatus DAOM BR117]|uniref:Uncharacterized protein n=2 Tax=Spizellomyces punctatus (strain DAOM BR117) TaxID=645134 RepID=A0A0L0HSM2_SPIPD|nr:uncharacterized protein SPPG_01326 [Spizellomyces punctatus DAOM BR117]KND03874.1 hypothetical protein SPPG_01326 [Spizellomyces punctatus DAOM BR117]|eukprot:XP_016611913.1 hypothetical protein SPPG_01326 [Spizellomyces punctatus DAOM BR117]
MSKTASHSMTGARNVALGAVFGLALEKSKVYLPDIIINQMLLRQWTMGQMFFTAAAGGTIIVTILEATGVRKRSCKPPVSAGLSVLGEYGANIVGGSLLGAGMALSGACPGTVLVQLGAGLGSSVYVLVGALGSSITYGYIARWIQTSFPTFGKKSPVKTVDGALKHNALFTSTITASALIAAVYVLHSMTSWSHNVISAYQNRISQASFSSTSSSLTSLAWSPIAGGALVALLQFPSVTLCGSPIGASGSYMELASRVVAKIDKNWRKNAPVYADFITSNTGLLFASGVIVGSFLSAYTGGAWPLNRSLEGSSPIKSVIGGAMLLFGARMAGGCTSGHGISGIAQLSLASIVTVAAMFAGGIASAFLLY